MKANYLYQEYQCPYCGIDMEDVREKYLKRILFTNIKPQTMVACGHCFNRFKLCYNDMEGKFVSYKNDKIPNDSVLTTHDIAEIDRAEEEKGLK